MSSDPQVPWHAGAAKEGSVYWARTFPNNKQSSWTLALPSLRHIQVICSCTYNNYMFNTHTHACMYIYIYVCVCLCWFYRCAYRCTCKCTKLHTDAYKHAYIHAYSRTCISLDTYGIGHRCRFRFGLIWALQYVMAYHKNCTQHNNHTTEHTIHTDLSLHADLSPFLSLSLNIHIYTQYNNIYGYTE